MAHFAELDSNNKVLRVLTACNQDIANNGGELSEQAANYFGTYTPFSENGVKWVQTSYNNNFRKKFAGIGYTYDQVKDKFIAPQNFPSWSLDSNDNWQAPIQDPSNNLKYYIWNEEAYQADNTKGWILENNIDQPYPSWSLDVNDDWQPPISKPNDGKEYVWNEEAYQADNIQGWVLVV
jgi:hypothetical protein